MNQLATEYDSDFHAWIQHHITLLKEGRFGEIDAEHLILELEDMGKSNLRDLESRFIILIAHLLKWQFQPDKRSNSWSSSINEQRVRIARLLRKTPSLKRELYNAIEDALPDTLEIAVDDTTLPPSIFPNKCPYTIEQLLDKTFYPESKDF